MENLKGKNISWKYVSLPIKRGLSQIRWFLGITQQACIYKYLNLFIIQGLSGQGPNERKKWDSEELLNFLNKVTRNLAHVLFLKIPTLFRTTNSAWEIEEFEEEEVVQSQ